MESDGFKVVCAGCQYKEFDYCAKADEYGCDPISEYCNKAEYGIARCPRAAQWREWFKNHGKRGEVMYDESCGWGTDVLDTPNDTIRQYGQCPICGGKIVRRRRKSDGLVFGGCSNFPNCKFSCNESEVANG